MKIIATAGERDRKYFIEASDDEIAKLLGFYHAGQNDCPRFKVGDTINIAALYSRLASVSQNKAMLERFANELRGMAARCVELAPLIHEAEGGEKP